MKFLIIQENGRHIISKHLRECNSLQRALWFNGELCDVWGLGHDNFKTVPDYEQYDVIINLENYDVGWVPDLSGTVKPLKLLWAIDSHCQGKDYYSNIFSRGKYHKILEATKHFVDQNSVWFPNCYDSDFIVPMKDVEKKTFLGFCGNYVNRYDVFNFIREAFPDFKLDIDVRGINMIRAINSYQIHFNKNMSNDINYRNFETMGCGTFLLTNYDGQYDELGFNEGEHYYVYRSLPDAVDKINYLKRNPRVITDVAVKGHMLALEKHTFKIRAKELINIVKGL
jgi:Glycosyl transferases group 1